MARVLLVDDDEELLWALERGLGRDHEVRVARSVPMALAALAEGPIPDIVITDWNMPPHTGEELLEVLAIRYPQVYRILHTSTPNADLAGAGALAHHILYKDGELRTLRNIIAECFGALAGS
jgi:DNA-binding NtrC family response regulator